MYNQEFTQILQDQDLNNQILSYQRKIYALYEYDNSVDEEDILQMIFLKALSVIEKFKTKHKTTKLSINSSDFRSYFNRSLKHLLLDLSRTKESRIRFVYGEDTTSHSEKQDLDEWLEVVSTLGCKDIKERILFYFDGLNLDIIQLVINKPDFYIKKHGNSLNVSKIAKTLGIDRRVVAKGVESIQNTLKEKIHYERIY